MIASCPASRVVRLPDTGASSMLAPVSATLSASRRLASGSIVLISAYTFPGPSPARIPSSPETICSTAVVSVTMESTTSTAWASSRGVPATAMPFAASGSLRPSLRFQPVTARPRSRRRSTILPPIEPSPTNPTLSPLALISLPLEREHVLVAGANAERSQPVELAVNDRHAIPEFDELGLAEVAMEAGPQIIVGDRGIPGDRLRPAQRGALALVESIVVVELDDVIVAVQVPGAQLLQLAVDDPAIDHVLARLPVRAQDVGHPSADRIALPDGIHGGHRYRVTALTAFGASPSSVSSSTS